MTNSECFFLKQNAFIFKFKSFLITTFFLLSIDLLDHGRLQMVFVSSSTYNTINYNIIIQRMFYN